MAHLAYVEECIKDDVKFLISEFEKFDGKLKPELDQIALIEKAFEQQKITGQLIDHNLLLQLGISLENIENADPNVLSTENTRPKRTAATDARRAIQSQSMRKVRDTTNNLSAAVVKFERLTLTTNPTPEVGTDALVNQLSDVHIKSEPMPPPIVPPKKNLRGKKANDAEKLSTVSTSSLTDQSLADVIVEESNVSIIDLTDTPESSNKRTKRTKRKKRTGSNGTSEQRKRSKSDEMVESSVDKEEICGPNQTYLKAIEDVEPSNVEANATYIKPSENDDIANKTITVSKPTMINSNLTEKPGAIKKTTKPIFSPFGQSPVKKRVEAFEKLNTVESESNTIKRTESVKSTRYVTPNKSRFAPPICSTALKKNTPTSTGILSSASKMASAMKASQAEYRERERLRREKESEVKRNEALVAAQMEERRKKREEKQARAKLQREILEKEKLKNLEAQRNKEERHRQLLLEQEEKKQRLREEQEKKRQLAKERKNQLMKQHAESNEPRRKAEAEIKKEPPIPRYKREKAPLLPTADCYDSDDEEYKTHRNRNPPDPEWMADSRLFKEWQMAMKSAGEVVKNNFFSCGIKTCDLKEVFEVVSLKQLKRTSSAVWQTPPRYTLLIPPSSNASIAEED